ncbi:uncharacterized protein LOC107268644 [Cephus cinctus]|uniref:Uncharacterized protein LOC107268644 n=1 Tax=Cephus cinctus TaxID=211228 RepID=A0AAJ7BY31_CEPCN|nr:uncharacterized protein LOC107268644 [Cephus cinctus]
MAASTTKTDRMKTPGNSYWKHVLNHYEERNALLERKQAALVERLRFMECTLPSLLMGAVVNMKSTPDSLKAQTTIGRSGNKINRSQNSTTSNGRHLVKADRIRAKNILN